jgi:hypothetical protein
MEMSIASMTPQTWTVKAPEATEYTVQVKSDTTGGSFNLKFSKQQ